MSLAPILQVSAGNLSTGALPRDPKAPELLVAINTCTVPPGEDVPQLDPGQASSVEAILAQIWKRLTGGLDHVWQSPDGHDPEWEPRPEGAASASGAEPIPSADEIEAEESWARCCSELMDATGYGSAPSHDSGKASDSKLFTAFWSKDPVIPVLMACQQLCTFAFYFRGYSDLDVGWKGIRGVTAGHNTHLAHLFEGGWDRSRDFADIQKAFGRTKGGLVPGSVFGFLPKTDKNEQLPGAHVVFVLRTAKSVGKAQFLDTGAARTSTSGLLRSQHSAHALHGFRGGNYDNHLFDGTVQVTSNQRPVPYVGLGVLKPTGAARMLEGVTRARKARPLGLARLAIFRRPVGQEPVEDKDILYMSPRLLMHDTTSMHNFYMSRYYWSLRAMPGYQNLQAIWEISIPQFALFHRMLDTARDVPLSKIWSKDAQSRWVMWITVDGNGLSRCLTRYTSVASKGDEDNMELSPKYRQNNYGKLKNRLERTPPEEDFASPSLAGSLSPPPYFRRWGTEP